MAPVTIIQSAEVKAFQDDLIDRAVRYARENEFCDTFTQAMEELFPGVPAVDSDGLDCEGERPELDVDAIKAAHEKDIMDRLIRLARNHTTVISTQNAKYALGMVLPGVAQVDSVGRGL
jgi:hypothetical protein